MADKQYEVDMKDADGRTLNLGFILAENKEQAKRRMLRYVRKNMRIEKT